MTKFPPRRCSAAWWRSSFQAKCRFWLISASSSSVDANLLDKRSCQMGSGCRGRPPSSTSLPALRSQARRVSLARSSPGPSTRIIKPGRKRLAHSEVEKTLTPLSPEWARRKPTHSTCRSRFCARPLMDFQGEVVRGDTGCQTPQVIDITQRDRMTELGELPGVEQVGWVIPHRRHVDAESGIATFLARLACVVREQDELPDPLVRDVTVVSRAADAEHALGHRGAWRPVHPAR